MGSSIVDSSTSGERTLPAVVVYIHACAARAILSRDRTEDDEIFVQRCQSVYVYNLWCVYIKCCVSFSVCVSECVSVEKASVYDLTEYLLLFVLAVLDGRQIEARPVRKQQTARFL